MKKCEVLEILSNKKVLCLEDEPGILKNITEILELFFKEVKGCCDGVEALDEISINNYDVLVLDICVPNIDGLEVVKKVRQKDHKIPIIILSSHTEQEYLWRAVELNITRYLVKPYNKATFLKALEDVALALVEYQPVLILNSELKYDFAKKIVYIKDAACYLSKSESRLFEYFLKNQNQTVSYERLFDYIWGDCDQPTKEAIKAIIKELRKKIGKDVIKNLYGIGYVFTV